jgi:hypothetical protein
MVRRGKGGGARCGQYSVSESLIDAMHMVHSQPPPSGDQGILPTPKCCSIGIISRSSYCDKTSE